MAKQIKRVAVLGAGVMGTGIAAHLTGSGLDVVLLDIVPPKVSDEDSRAGLKESDRAFRNKFAISALAKAKKSKPPTFHSPVDAGLIAVGNFDDDFARVADCDWIIEVVVENLDIKRALFEKIEQHRTPGTIITSNTSGLRISAMVEGRSDDFRRHFFVTHFFNPVRFMRLLELVPGTETLPEVIQTIARLGADTLGKGIVYGKDTPNFIANRIGMFSMMYLLNSFVDKGFSIAEIDALFGPPTGRPKSAVFRTADLVGLDTMIHVANNCYENLTHDECRDTFKVPDLLTTMVERGWRGQKSGQGFYKKQGKTILELDPSTLEYSEKTKVRADSIGKVRKIGDPAKRLKTLLSQDDRFAEYAWDVTARTLIYSANRIGEITDDVVNVDKAMRWGFNWDLGPFEAWDAIGVRESVERMKTDGLAIPERVTAMLESGNDTFYGGSASKPTYYDFSDATYAELDIDPRYIKLTALKEQERVVQRNSGASIYDLGDGVLGVEFHTKMNAINPDIISSLSDALDRAEREQWCGVVVGNDDPQAFCAGADIFMMLVAAGQKQWDTINQMIENLQRTTLRMRHSDVPVVTAPAGLALGGGAEVAMAANVVRSHAELYMGLVEIGVGLIPAGGGCLMMLERFCSNLPDDPAFDPTPFVQQAFTNIAMAKVSVGAEDARRLGMLRQQDAVTMNRDLLLHDAKQTVLGLHRAGYRAPRPVRLRLPGENGAANFRWFVENMRQGEQVTDHEALIAGKLAWILCGGNTSTRTTVSQKQILELEREAFLSLLGEKKTQERMQHMLQKGKPLRN